MNKKLISLILFWVFHFTAQAIPGFDCGFNIDVNNIVFNSIGSSVVYTANLNVSRTLRLGFCRTIYIGFDTGNAGNYNREMFNSSSDRLSYNLYKDNTSNVPLKALADASNSNEYVRLAFQGNQSTVSATIEGRLPIPNQGRTFLPEGRFVDLVNATVVGGLFNSDSDTTNFQIEVTNPIAVDISLVPPGSTFDPSATSYTLDYAEITQGESRRVDLRVKSNAGFTVSLESQGGGRMLHTSENDNIQYTLKVNNGVQSFSGPGVPLVIGTATGVTQTNGSLFELEFLTGSPAGKLAGQYQDVITIIATSNN